MTTEVELLRTALAAAVPLRIMEIASGALGTLTEADVERVRGYLPALLEHGDDLLYRGRKGATAERFNQLTHAIAALAFQPGGVTFLGLHFEEPA